MPGMIRCNVLYVMSHISAFVMHYEYLSVTEYFKCQTKLYNTLFEEYIHMYVQEYIHTYCITHS